MKRYLMGQLVGLLGILLVASFIIFLSIHIAPGSAETAIVGQRTVSPERLAAIRAQYHLDDPFFVQYLRWLGDAVRLDLGDSIVLSEPVSNRIRQAAPSTIMLVLYAETMVIALGVTGAAIAAKYPGWRDAAITAVTSIAAAIPAFVAAIYLSGYLAVNRGWFPVLGGGEGFLDRIYHLTLPAVSLALLLCALLARVGRAAMRTELGGEHVETAIARGLPARRVFRRHVLRNAAAPMISVVALQVPALVAGTVVVEQVFNIDGLGSLLMTGVNSNDFPIVQAVGLIIVTLTVVSGVIADIAYAALDPRVTVGERP